MENRIKEIAEYYGYYNQSLIAIEEMAELTKELLKLRRMEQNKYVSIQSMNKHINTKIAEEIADVQIMIEQLIYLFEIKDKVQDAIDIKLNRQLKRMENE